MKTDQQLQSDVMDELKWDPILNASEIGVSVKNGVVTLSGYVNTYSKKLAAENAVKRVKGVKAVAEDIEVRFGVNDHRNDTEIAEAALDALKWNTNVPDESIKLKVENGWVTMEGTVDWKFQKDAAANAIKDITGVKAVSNFLTLKPRVNTTIVTNKIKSALQRSAAIEANNIDVDAEGATVILTGKVRSWTERQEVEKAAWSAPGVVKVEDHLMIGA